MKKQFYEIALPTQGIYCIGGIGTDKKIRQRFAETIDELIQITDKFTQEGFNVYVTPNSYRANRRREDDALFGRSFYIDLDVNHGSVCYTSKEEALEALSAFVTDTGLPEPIRVDSGTGIQAYWVFEKNIPIIEWQGAAEKFRAFCIKNKLKIDPVVTADSTRFMRCPDTYNYKTDPPTPTKILSPSLFVHAFESVNNILGDDEPDEFVEPVDVLASIQKGRIDDIDIGNKYLRSSFELIAQKSVDDEGGCNQIKRILFDAETLDRDSWRGGISIAVNCIEGAEAAHDLSKPYPRYNYEETQKQADSLVGKPFKCSTFEKYNAGGCAGCPHLGRITNPLALGQVVETTRVETDEVRVEKEAPPEFPESIMPYARHVDGGIYYIPPPTTNKEGKVHQDSPIQLTTHDVYPISRVYNKTDGYSLIMRHTLPADPHCEFTLNLSAVVSMDEFKKILAKNDILVPLPHVPKMYDYIRKWVQYFQNEKAKIMRMQLGWTEENDAFVFGKFEIRKDAGESSFAASPMIKNVSKLVRPEGEYSAWRKSADMLDLPGFEIQAFGMLLGFGAPLMRYTSTAGCAVNFLNSDTGAGKTAALYSGLSVFCDPVNSSLIEGSATANAMIGRYLALKNIMFGIDEVGNFDPKEMSKLLHMVSQGKAKLRMQSSVNAERELEMGASTLLVMSSNQSIYDKMFSIKARPDGEIARLIELTVKRPKLMDEDPHKYGYEIFNPFRFNFGHAGPMLISELFRIGDTAIRTKMDKWSEKFTKDFEKDPAYRFYCNTIVSSFTAGEIAVEAGIINLNLERIYKAIIAELEQIREKTISLNKTDYKAMLTEFMYAQWPNFLTLQDKRIVSEPRNALVARIEVDEQTIYIVKDEFKKFLGAKQISIREFEKPMEKAGIYTGTVKKRLGAGWKVGMGAPPPINVMVFKNAIPDELLNKNAE